MDSRGAQELAQVLRERQGDELEERLEIVTEGARPIFHWVGVEPPAADPAAEVDEPAEARGRGRSRLGRRGRK